jgi:hypothetical protein
MAQRALTQCDQCGQIDDHPKAHIAKVGEVLTLHHDCLSHSDEELLRESAQARGAGPKASAIIDACKSGVRGPKLLALIESGKLPMAEGLHEQAQIAIEKEAAK